MVHAIYSLFLSYGVHGFASGGLKESGVLALDQGNLLEMGHGCDGVADVFIGELHALLA